MEIPVCPTSAVQKTGLEEGRDGSDNPLDLYMEKNIHSEH